MSDAAHSFSAFAFEQNFLLKDIASAFPEGRIHPHELRATEGPGNVFVFPFGAVVFQNVPQERRQSILSRLYERLPGLNLQVTREDYLVKERSGQPIDLTNGVLVVDRMTIERASIVALTVAQSAAMEYYESIVEKLYAHTSALVDQLEARGTVPYRVRPLHRFIGEAIGVRNEVLSVLHLLDKPDAIWDDLAMDQIYRELKAEFDLEDRYRALESKVKSVQEALELVLDVARDRRMYILEAAIVLLIVLEIVLSLLKIMK
ncbi:MAG: RMD1 family protein [Thermoanaerobaculia bacterium]|nr:RMD1 family protein [Thermoanaerobaculia bacterium]